MIFCFRCRGRNIVCDVSSCPVLIDSAGKDMILISLSNRFEIMLTQDFVMENYELKIIRDDRWSNGID